MGNGLEIVQVRGRGSSYFLRCWTRERLRVPASAHGLCVQFYSFPIPRYLQPSFFLSFFSYVSLIKTLINIFDAKTDNTIQIQSFSHYKVKLLLLFYHKNTCIHVITQLIIRTYLFYYSDSGLSLIQIIFLKFIIMTYILELFFCGRNIFYTSIIVYFAQINIKGQFCKFDQECKEVVINCVNNV